jgi:F-type H+-transporting ATPase subunit b
MKKLFGLILLIFYSDAFAAEAGAEAQKGIFGGSIADAVWTIISFTVLVILLARFAWKPLLANLAAREEHIKHQIKVAEDARLEAQRLLEEHRHRAFQMIKDASDEALIRSQQIIEKAREEAIEAKRKSEEDIRNAQAIFSEHLWKQSSEVILSVGSKVLEKSITKEDNQRLIDEAIEKLKRESAS